ncbi:hypothetical protein DPMN_127983 [Dreissena polymorpha]|uniref:Uncharacterized protein n=1 Tax=Dreissena polymorpha TaxID=45954 RepID=A0A9D4H2Z7_DREPO|nr:hypothetical protein DPMN_127983 [Dreissena polymorpha]
MAHNVPLLVLTFLVLAAFIVVCVFNGLASGGSNTGLYKSSTGAISDKYYVEITPAGWTFSI